MPATELSAALVQIRDFLIETKARFWSDAELTAIYNLGVQDLWGSILDVHGEHFMVVNDHVMLKGGETELSGVPIDCFRVLLVESRSGCRAINFHPRKYNSADFSGARGAPASDSVDDIYYHVSGVGAPVAAPRILTAPRVVSDLPISLAYCPTISLGAYNPIPGQSDNALKAWTLAYALGKEGAQGARVPDTNWLQIYSTEKQLILVRITPRQEQEPDVVDDVFQGIGHL